MRSTIEVLRLIWKVVHNRSGPRWLHDLDQDGLFKRTNLTIDRRPEETVTYEPSDIPYRLRAAGVPSRLMVARKTHRHRATPIPNTSAITPRKSRRFRRSHLAV